MERRIMFIGETEESFLVIAMEKTLSDAGFEVVFCRPSVHDIASVDNPPDIMIVYIEGDEMRFNMMYPFLQKLLTEEGKNRYLYLIGNQVEIQAAYKIIPHMLVSGAFKRPVNSSDLIAQLNIICSDHAYDSVDGAMNNIDEKPNKKSILLVDDDSVLLRSMQTWLSISYNVFIASSGTNTISFLRQRKVDLILLDYAMPGLSGLEVFQILKSDPETADIPVIFLTAKDDKDTVMKVLSVKPANYLLKPIPPTILRQTVGEFFKAQEDRQKLEKKAASWKVDDDAPLSSPDELFDVGVSEDEPPAGGSKYSGKYGGY